MAHGLYVTSPTGKVTISPSYRMGRFLGSLRVTGPGSLSVPAFSQGTPWYFYQEVNGLKDAYITLSVSGTTLSWTHTSRFGQTVDAIIFYGVF